jgi:hypothetical protein
VLPSTASSLARDVEKMLLSSRSRMTARKVPESRGTLLGARSQPTFSGHRVHGPTRSDHRRPATNSRVPKERRESLETSATSSSSHRRAAWKVANQGDVRMRRERPSSRSEPKTVRHPHRESDDTRRGEAAVISPSRRAKREGDIPDSPRVRPAEAVRPSGRRLDKAKGEPVREMRLDDGRIGRRGGERRRSPRGRWRNSGFRGKAVEMPCYNASRFVSIRFGWRFW